MGLEAFKGRLSCQVKGRLKRSRKLEKELKSGLKKGVRGVKESACLRRTMRGGLRKRLREG